MIKAQDTGKNYGSNKTELVSFLLSIPCLGYSCNIRNGDMLSAEGPGCLQNATKACINLLASTAVVPRKYLLEMMKPHLVMSIIHASV